MVYGRNLDIGKPVPTLDQLLSALKNPSQWYGLTSNNLARNATAGVVITGGNVAWGTELSIHDGTVVESGLASKSLILAQLSILAVGTANRPTYLQFYQNSRGAAVACTFETTVNTVTKAGHGLANGTKLMLTGASIPAAVNTYTVYYVVGAATDTFQLSLTLGGSAIAFAGNGSGNYHLLTQSLWCEVPLNVAATTGQAAPIQVNSSPIPCNSFISARGLATTGGTNAITFLMGVNTY